MNKVQREKYLRLFKRWECAEAKANKARDAVEAYRRILAQDCKHPKRFVTANRFCLVCREIT